MSEVTDVQANAANRPARKPAPAGEVPARSPLKLCGMRYPVSYDEQTGEADDVYCGLHVHHSGPHTALLWWFDDPR